MRHKKETDQWSLVDGWRVASTRHDVDGCSVHHSAAIPSKQRSLAICSLILWIGLIRAMSTIEYSSTCFQYCNHREGYCRVTIYLLDLWSNQLLCKTTLVWMASFWLFIELSKNPARIFVNVSYVGICSLNSLGSTLNYALTMRHITRLFWVFHLDFMLFCGIFLVNDELNM